MIAVVGGSYLEQCLFPSWGALFGSGGRAAAALSGKGVRVRLHTYIAESDERKLEALAQAFGFSYSAAKIERTISFEYIHGFSTPVIRPERSFIKLAAPLSVRAKAVIRYGFIEGDAVVDGDRVVYDPQSPSYAEDFWKNGSQAKELAVVANVRETVQLGGSADPLRAAKAIISEGRANIVVVKGGPSGAHVVTAKDVVTIPSFKTPFVWPIGSGDVFVAIFGYLWAETRQSATVAARMASRATAYYCSTQSLPIPRSAFKSLPNTKLFRPRRSPSKTRIYLAGPFFSISQRWLVEEVRSAFLSIGFQVFSPVHDVGHGIAAAVAPADLSGLARSDLVFALVDGLDSGTLFEIGYATAKRIPVISFVQNERQEDLKMLAGTGSQIENDLATAIYRATWLALG